MSLPIACPFDGYATPQANFTQNFSDGTPRYKVICPICDNQTADYPSQQAATDAWNTRATLTYNNWLAFVGVFVGTAPTMAALYAYIQANPPIND